MVSLLSFLYLLSVIRSFFHNGYHIRVEIKGLATRDGIFDELVSLAKKYATEAKALTPVPAEQPTPHYCGPQHTNCCRHCLECVVLRKV